MIRSILGTKKLFLKIYLQLTKSNFSEKFSESNLIEYLQKKQEPNIDEIVKEAQSIIEKQNKTTSLQILLGTNSCQY